MLHKSEIKKTITAIAVIVFFIFSTHSFAQVRLKKYLPTIVYSAHVFEMDDHSFRIIGNTVGPMGGCPGHIAFIKTDSTGNLIYKKIYLRGIVNLQI